MTICIGDVHGEYDLLMRLFDKLPHDNLVFTGDLIDRGPNAKKVVDFVKNNNYNCVMGNHEDFAIQSYKDNLEFEYHTYQMWLQNGARATLNSYDPNLEDFFEHREWFKTLPILHWIDEKTVVSHSYYLPYIGKESYSNFAECVLWGRDSGTDHVKIDISNITNIIGHSIVENVSFYGNYINIDTGGHHYGKLSAYDTETGIIYTAEKEK